MLKKKGVITYLVFCIVVMTTSVVTAAEKIFFISHAGLGDPFWKIEFNGASKAAEEVGVDLTILAPETPNDMIRQIELLESVIAEGTDGIATTISDPDAFDKPLKKARSMGIPVIAYNTRPINDDRTKNPYLAYIGMDDYLSGKIMAKRILAKKKDLKRVVVGMQSAGHAGLESRYKGIYEIMSSKGIIVDKIDTGNDPQVSTRIGRDYITKHPDLSAIICLGPMVTHSVGRIIQKEGHKIYMASFDITPLTVKLIKDDIIDFTVDQQPYMQGYLAIKFLVLAIRYKMTPTDVNTGVGFVHKKNIIEVERLSKAAIR